MTDPWTIIGWILLTLAGVYVFVWFLIPITVRLCLKIQGAFIPPLEGQVWMLDTGLHMKIESVSDKGVGFKCYLPYSASSFSYTHRSCKDWRVIQLLHTERILSGPTKTPKQEQKQ